MTTLGPTTDDITEEKRRWEEQWKAP